MDDSSVTLEESLSLFEEGISLIKLCNNKLDTAEKKIKILMSEKDDYVEKDFSLEKNSND
jgi:exodeoxyribonuclease VII small subunit